VIHKVCVSVGGDGRRRRTTMSAEEDAWYPAKGGRGQGRGESASCY
jgi:hypothetical protein